MPMRIARIVPNDPFVESRLIEFHDEPASPEVNEREFVGLVQELFDLECKKDEIEEQIEKLSARMDEIECLSFEEGA